jgi:hypothetical protein
MLDPANFVSDPALGRACGTCTLCCKVYDVPAVEKLAGQWCRHARTGKGCGIHETRPQHCRSFHCLWMTQAWLGPEWKPEQAKMVLSVDPVTQFLFVQVDPGQPAAWRREPYYRQLKQWAAGAIARGRQVVVFVNKSATVILPEQDVALGILGPADRIVARERRTIRGLEIEVEKVTAAA